MNFAVLADLNATRANCEAFRLALKKLDGSVSYCKFYSARAVRTSPSRFITGKRRVSTCVR